MPEVLANFSLLASMLIKDDFPTLLLPINAYSGSSGGGQYFREGLLRMYFAALISTDAN